MSSLPTPDPAAGNAAEQQASQERRTALEALTAGTSTLTDLFTQVDAETDHHHLGHIHVRAALLALPGIGEVKADKILADFGWDHDRHVDTLGVNERTQLEEAIAAA